MGEDKVLRLFNDFSLYYTFSITCLFAVVFRP